MPVIFVVVLSGIVFVFVALLDVGEVIIALPMKGEVLAVPIVLGLFEPVDVVSGIVLLEVVFAVVIDEALVVLAVELVVVVLLLVLSAVVDVLLTAAVVIVLPLSIREYPNNTTKIANTANICSLLAFMIRREVLSI